MQRTNIVNLFSPGNDNIYDKGHNSPSNWGAIWTVPDNSIFYGYKISLYKNILYLA